MKIKYFVQAAVVLLLWLASLPAQAYHEIAGGPIIVNGQELSSQQGNQLIQAYGAVASGNYWYDPASGLWGLRGGPGIGQIAPYLDLGGPLRADASGGGSGVFINGRELHFSEVNYLQRLYGSVTPGRYWMNARMIGGFEGGPAIFDLNAAAGQGGGSGYNRNTHGGGLMSDGN